MISKTNAERNILLYADDCLSVILAKAKSENINTDRDTEGESPVTKA